MTDIEVLKDAIDSIGRINLPITMIDQIGAELNRVRNNLIILHDTITKQRNEEDANSESDTEEENEVSNVRVLDAPPEEE